MSNILYLLGYHSSQTTRLGHFRTSFPASRTHSNRDKVSNKKWTFQHVPVHL